MPRHDNPVLLTYQGETLPLTAWVKRTGLSHNCLYNRYVTRQWSAARTLETPSRAKPQTSLKHYEHIDTAIVAYLMAHPEEAARYPSMRIDVLP